MCKLDSTGTRLDLSRPLVMGILNVTPDSFSDGGAFIAPNAAIAQARRMLEEGADIIDVGGESTRPGAAPVSEQQELDRVIPVIEAITATLPVLVSVDTSKPEVINSAVAAGAGMINDVMALQTAGSLDAAAQTDVPVCLMHMQGQPRTMQIEPRYEAVVDDVIAFLSERVARCEQAGIDRGRLFIDPGFGFGKTLAHNLSLLKNLDRFAAMKLPLLVGISRKSMLGTLLNDAPMDARLHASLAAAVMAVERGAVIVRAHDVKPTVDALAVVRAVLNADD